MRITNGMIKNNMMNSLYGNMDKLDTLYNQMNTLKKVQRPSDDPIIVGRALKLKINVAESQQHQSNVKEATGWMESTESALSNMNEILKDVRTRLNNASTGTLGKEDKEKLVNDIEQLYNQLAQEANVTYAGRYVFSGYKTDQPVFLTKDTALKQETTLEGDLTLKGEMTLKEDTIAVGAVTAKNGTAYAAGDTIPAGTVLAEGTTLLKGTVLAKDTVIPNGTLNPEVLGKIDGQHMEYEIGVNTTIEVNTLGMPEFMNGVMEDMQEILKQMKDPNVTDEELGKMFTGMIGEFDEHLKDVSAMTADLGSRQTRLEYTSTRLVNDTTNFKELLSKTEDVDIEETYVDFNTQFAVYQSALQATAKVIMPNLAQFLN